MSVPTTAVPSSMAFHLEKQQKPFGKFLRAEPKLLGISLIMFAGMYFGFGFAIHFGATSITEYLGVSWWLSVMFVVSGILTIISGESPNKQLVTACLAVNILAALFAGLAVFFCSLNIPSWMMDLPATTDRDRRHFVLKLGLNCFLTLVAVTGLAINVTLSVFSCRGLRYCRPSSSAPVVIVSAPLSDNPTIVSN